jgi:hypothetical protein
VKDFLFSLFLWSPPVLQCLLKDSWVHAVHENQTSFRFSDRGSYNLTRANRWLDFRKVSKREKHDMKTISLLWKLLCRRCGSGICHLWFTDHIMIKNVLSLSFIPGRQVIMNSS